MADKQPNNPQNSSDEIDLGQLFRMIGNGFNSLFKVFLRLFLYLKKNFIILVSLIIVGAAIGYGLNQIVSQKLKTEVIVKPQMESKNYLYDVINEIQANIKAKDTIFFKSIGISNVDFNALEVTIAPVDDNKVGTEGEMKYFELLQSFENTNGITDIVRAELENKSSFNHRIKFFYKNSESGRGFAKKIMEYINTNEYFGRLNEIFRDNASSRIQQNEVLLKQVDKIIENYTNSLATEKNSSLNERIVLDNKEQVNIADLFEYKNRLIRDIETKKLELEENVNPVSIINFGRPQIVQKSFFGKSIVLIPIVLLLGFFFISFLNYLNRKAKEL